MSIPPPPPPPKSQAQLRPAVVPGGATPPKTEERTGRRRTIVWIIALLAAALLGPACWWGYDASKATKDASEATKYARLAELKLSRDWLDPDTVGVSYVPLSSGTVLLRRRAKDRPTAEMPLRIGPAEVGNERKIRWPLDGLKAGEVIEVVSREGGALVTAKQTVPEAIVPPGMKAAAGGDDDEGGNVGLYSRRTKAGRAQWLGKYGGTPESEKAVAAGLDWLARHQAADGSWSNRCLGSGPESRCEKSAPCTDGGGTFEMAHTGLAVLAFQAGGYYDFNDTAYSAVVRKALDWIANHQEADGALVGSLPINGPGGYHKNFMYEHGIAAFALGDAVAAALALHEPPRVRYLQGLRKAVKFIEQNQHHDGGWRYGGGRNTDRLGDASDTSVTGWQVLALKSAAEAGVPPDGRCLAAVRKFLDARRTTHGQTAYQGSVQTQATTGVGMLARQLLFDEPEAPLVGEAAGFLADYAEKHWPQEGRPTGPDYYLWYNCTLAMFLSGSRPWERWNACVRDTIIALQDRKGCQRGSWDPKDRWGSSGGGGRIYSTALAVLTLEVYYRYALDQAER